MFQIWNLIKKRKQFGQNLKLKLTLSKKLQLCYFSNEANLWSSHRMARNSYLADKPFYSLIYGEKRISDENQQTNQQLNLYLKYHLFNVHDILKAAILTANVQNFEEDYIFDHVLRSIMENFDIIRNNNYNTNILEIYLEAICFLTISQKFQNIDSNSCEELLNNLEYILKQYGVAFLKGKRIFYSIKIAANLAYQLSIKQTKEDNNGKISKLNSVFEMTFSYIKNQQPFSDYEYIMIINALNLYEKAKKFHSSLIEIPGIDFSFFVKNGIRVPNEFDAFMLNEIITFFNNIIQNNSNYIDKKFLGIIAEAPQKVELTVAKYLKEVNINDIFHKSFCSFASTSLLIPNENIDMMSNILKFYKNWFCQTKVEIQNFNEEAAILSLKLIKKIGISLSFDAIDNSMLFNKLFHQSKFLASQTEAYLNALFELLNDLPNELTEFYLKKMKISNNSSAYLASLCSFAKSFANDIIHKDLSVPNLKILANLIRFEQNEEIKLNLQSKIIERVNDLRIRDSSLSLQDYLDILIPMYPSYDSSQTRLMVNLINEIETLSISFTKKRLILDLLKARSLIKYNQNMDFYKKKIISKTNSTFFNIEDYLNIYIYYIQLVTSNDQLTDFLEKIIIVNYHRLFKENHHNMKLIIYSIAKSSVLFINQGRIELLQRLIYDYLKKFEVYEKVWENRQYRDDIGMLGYYLSIKLNNGSKTLYEILNYQKHSDNSFSSITSISKELIDGLESFVFYFSRMYDKYQDMVYYKQIQNEFWIVNNKGMWVKFLDLNPTNQLIGIKAFLVPLPTNDPKFNKPNINHLTLKFRVR